jgi:hypothetical protein
MGEDLGTFTHEGETLPERWLSEAFPLALEIFFAASGAGQPFGEAAAGFGPVGTPFPVQELSISFSPLFLHFHAGGTSGVTADGPFDIVTPTAADPGGVPTGAWSVTLMSFTGQTWTVPNEIATLGLPQLDPELSQEAQGGTLQLLP